MPLGELAAFRNGINFTKSSKGTPIKILGVKDFQNHYWAPFEDFDSIVPDGAVPDSDILIEGDIVFVRSNGNPDLIGRCLLIGTLPERTTHSGFTIKARLQSNDVMPAYLCHFLKSNSTRQEMIDGGNGANIKSLNQGTLSRIVVPFPSSAKQAEIVRRLERMQAETQRLESLYQQKLTALDDLKKSLLHQAFSCQL
ncbi:MAG: restriction endonuclease subunit S [Dechloromonas sp.]|nr:MAG: restriction endonuclease subunit S [Dechloromonas sp.]